MDNREAIEQLRREAVEALSARLTEDQSQVVFADGDPNSPLMLVGEAPGPEEDRQGRPFVGRSGQLLEETLDGLGLSRERVWISNTVKVWPNKRNGRSLKTRPPNAEEKRLSRPFFEREIAIVRPNVILCLGGTAAQALIHKSIKITKDRGEWFEGPQGIPTLPTLHPSYILRLLGMAPEKGNQSQEAFTDDLRRAAERAGLL